MKYERLLGSYYDIALYEYLEKTEWGQNFYEKLVDGLNQALKEDIEMIVLKELGGEPDEFIHVCLFKSQQLVAIFKTHSFGGVKNELQWMEKL